MLEIPIYVKLGMTIPLKYTNSIIEIEETTGHFGFFTCSKNIFFLNKYAKLCYQKIYPFGLN